MALVRPQQTRIQTAGLFVIDGGPLVLQPGDGLPEIPPVAVLMPKTRRWHAHKLRPCPSPAAWRRHQRRGEPICEKCRAWRADWDAERDRSTRDELAARRKPAGSACTDARRPA